jgi:hypothetical protein
MDSTGFETPKEQLAVVNAAIQTILAGGQSYQIGTRKVTRADLAQLRKMQQELMSEVNASTSSNLLENTVVGIFQGR